METKIRLAITLVLLSFIALGNPITFKGLVKDAKTGDCIPYVNIALIDVQKGTTSDHKGFFQIEIDESKLNSIISFSCLNYENIHVQVSKLRTTGINEIALNSLTY